MQQFIKGKGSSVDEIIFYITSSMQRQQKFIEALNQAEICPHPPKKHFLK
jgi:hypothetical protein